MVSIDNFLDLILPHFHQFIFENGCFKLFETGSWAIRNREVRASQFYFCSSSADFGQIGGKYKGKSILEPLELRLCFLSLDFETEINISRVLFDLHLRDLRSQIMICAEVSLNQFFQKEADKFFTSDSSLTSEDSDSDARISRNSPNLRPKKSDSPRKSRARSQNPKPKHPKSNQPQVESPKVASKKPTEGESTSSSSSKDRSSPKVAKKGPAKRMGAKCCKIKPVQKVRKGSFLSFSSKSLVKYYHHEFLRRAGR